MNQRIKSNHKQYLIFGILLLIAAVILTLFTEKARSITVLYGTGMAYIIIGYRKQNGQNTSETEKF